MLIKTFIAIGLTSFASLAFGADLPRFDVEGYCEDIGGGSHDMFNFCIEEEQKAYDQLRANASSLNPQTVSYCTDIAGNSYDMLLFCIEEENDAADNRQSFSFD